MTREPEYSSEQRVIFDLAAKNEELRAGIERLREIGNATFMAMCAFRDNKDEEVFQDAIDALGTALRREPKP